LLFFAKKAALPSVWVETGEGDAGGGEAIALQLAVDQVDQTLESGLSDEPWDLVERDVNGQEGDAETRGNEGHGEVLAVGQPGEVLGVPGKGDASEGEGGLIDRGSRHGVEVTGEAKVDGRLDRGSGGTSGGSLRATKLDRLPLGESRRQ
jgi:hypothetical protein